MLPLKKIVIRAFWISDPANSDFKSFFLLINPYIRQRIKALILLTQFPVSPCTGQGKKGLKTGVLPFIYIKQGLFLLDISSVYDKVYSSSLKGQFRLLLQMCFAVHNFCKITSQMLNMGVII